MGQDVKWRVLSRSEVLRKVEMKSTIVWDITPYSAVNAHRSLTEHATFMFRAEE
jgi:hypothetical protein